MMIRLSVAVFTSVKATIYVLMNNEVVLSLQPLQESYASSSTAAKVAAVESAKEESYHLRRMRHSAGDVTCVALEEYVSLPTNAVISIQFHAAVAAQAYLSIVKQ
jgi:hypothetical protein